MMSAPVGSSRSVSFTRGELRRKSTAIRGTMFAAKPLMMASVISPRRRPFNSSIRRCTRSISFSVWRTWRIKISPAVVSISLRGRRRNSGVPSSASSARIWRLIAEDATFSRAEAFRMEPRRATSSR
jgi:hypothetical protein